MRHLFSPSQKAHFDKGRALFFSPEAVKLRDDPYFRESQEQAMLEHYLKGKKYLDPRYGKKDVVIRDTLGNVVREGKEELPGYHLALDKEKYLSDDESLDLDIAETKRALSQPEVVDGFNTLSPEERDYVYGVIERQLSGGAIDKAGTWGTINRTYPQSYPDETLRGKDIPVNWEPGEKRAKGISNIADFVEAVDRDSGSGIFGRQTDLLHRDAVANDPSRMTALDNGRMGPSSLNQTVKEFTGPELVNALKTRDMRLYNERFYRESGVPSVWQGNLDSRTRAENAYQTKVEKGIDQMSREIREDDTIPYDKTRMAGDVFDQSEDGTGDQRAKAIHISTGGGDVHLGSAKVNGNGKH